MSGTAIPLGQFAQQLALAGAGADIASWTASIAAGNVQRSLATAFADAPFIEWFGACGLGGDDTAVFTTAVQSGIPFRLGPKTYIVNGSWSTGAASSFIVQGTAGLSRLLRMEGGSSGAWIGLECAVVVVDGVIFDANAASGHGEHLGRAGRHAGHQRAIRALRVPQQWRCAGARPGDAWQPVLRGAAEL